MKPRVKVVATAAAAVEPKKPTLVSVHKPVEGYDALNKKKPARPELATVDADPKPRGGVRVGAGRPAYLRPDERKKVAVYMSATEDERDLVRSRALESNLTVSYYIRKCCGLPIDV